MNYFDFMKLRSNWDFAKVKRDDYTFIGNFKTCDTDTTEWRRASTPWSWKAVENSDTSADTGPMERALNTKKVAESLEHLSIDSGATALNRINVVAPEWLLNIADANNLLEINARFLLQRPGQMSNLHIDSFYHKAADGNVASLKRTGLVTGRIMVMLSDWEFGQVMLFGNSSWTHWKIGDCVTWDAENIPHGGVNCGWHNREAVIVSGFRAATTIGI